MKKIIIFLFAATSTFQLFAQGTLQVPSGTTITSAGGAYIVLRDINCINNGSIQQTNGNGTVKFTGDDNVALSGSGNTTFDHLQLSKGEGALLALQSNIGIAEEINFGGGLLDLGNNNIDLGNTGVLNNESENSRPVSTGSGYIQFTANINNPSSYNPGNLGAVFTANANMGSTVIQRGFTSVTNSNGMGSSILRFYTISPTNNTALNATLRIQYLDAELNGLDENSLVQWKSADNLIWTNRGFTTRDASTNYVEKTGISDFSTWTLSTDLNVLPVSLLSLKAYQQGNLVKIDWQVAAEHNIAAYQVERSKDGVGFTKIGSVKASNLHNYTFEDLLPFDGINLYRLHLTDFDNASSYSQVVNVNTKNILKSLSVYPNPLAGQTFVIQLNNLAKGRYVLNIFNSLGQKVFSNDFLHTGGSASQTIHLSHEMAAGIYNIELRGSGKIYINTLIVK